MRLSEYERELLLSSPIYLKYAKTAFSSVTLASILADLNNITYCSIETLPLIKFLTQLAQARGWTQEVDLLSAIDTDFGAQIDYQLDVVRLLGVTPAHMRPVQCSDLDWHITEHTLSGGAIANAHLYEPGSGFTFQAYYAEPWCNGAGLAAQNYVLKYEDGAGPTSIIETNWRGGDQVRHNLFETGTADNVDLEISISGGSGTEHIFVGVLAGKFT